MGLVIANCKYAGGVPYNVFKKLYDTIVWPVIGYGAAVWGYRSFACINAVHHRAMRFFLGVGKYTPNAALVGEMAWLPPVVRQWKAVISYWATICNTDQSRLTKRVAIWANSKSSTACKNWFFNIRNKLDECNLSMYNDLANPAPKKHLVDIVGNASMDSYIAGWYDSINKITGIRNTGKK